MLLELPKSVALHTMSWNITEHTTGACCALSKRVEEPQSSCVGVGGGVWLVALFILIEVHG
jgi:hypothetical protein